MIKLEYKFKHCFDCEFNREHSHSQKDYQEAGHKLGRSDKYSLREINQKSI